MKHEDYEKRRSQLNEEQFGKIVEKIIKQPSHLDKQGMYKLFYILSPITTAQIFWDAFQATRNIPNTQYNKYAQNLMVTCTNFFDIINKDHEEIRAIFNREVIRLMDKSLLNPADKEALLRDHIFQQIRQSKGNTK